jgi:nucleoside-diphosphate-sugar epimerase
MNIFLTGGTGFIGKSLTQSLLQRGYSVTVLTRNPDSAKAKAVEAMGATLVRGNVSDRESLRAAMTGAADAVRDIVIHCAGWYKLGLTQAEKDEMRRTNVNGVENVLSLAAELGAKKIVHVSSMVAFGDTGDLIADEQFTRRAPPLTHYEQTKTEAHAIAKRFQSQGAPVVIVCPANVVGPGDYSSVGIFMRLYVRGLLPPFLLARNGRTALVYVDDCAEAIALAAERGRIGETFLLSGGSMVRTDFYKLWFRTPGGVRFGVYPPRAIMRPMSAALEPLQRALGMPVLLSRDLVDSAFGSFQFSGAKAERELGANFRSAEQGVLDTLAAERAIARQGKKGSADAASHTPSSAAH